MHLHRDDRTPRGQVLVMFALTVTVLVLVAGLVIDAGFGFGQRRAAQNASDLAAMAGARVLTAWVQGDTTNGTDANVVASINKTVADNGGLPIQYGAPTGPQYVTIGGAVLGYVGTGAIPGPSCQSDDTRCAAGVIVNSDRSWQPFFARLIGINTWSTTATATARGGYRAGGPPPGNLLPIGVSQATYNDAVSNGYLCNAGTPTASCTVIDLTEGTLNQPGGFGWLKFGCGSDTDDNGNPYGLGQNSSGCANNKPFLEGEWGDLSANPPVQPQTYGCCSAVGTTGSGDDIGSLPGNKASLNDSTPGVAYYETNEVVGFVPIWGCVPYNASNPDYCDPAGGNGSNGYYHIIGYAGFQIVHIKGAKDIQGILRQVIFNGPVSTTAPGFAGAPLAVQLIH